MKKSEIFLIILCFILAFALGFVGCLYLSKNNNKQGEEPSQIGEQTQQEVKQKEENQKKQEETQYNNDYILIGNEINEGNIASHIGEYVDLRNDPLGIGDTTHNWRILDIEGDNLLLILADYLPNAIGYANVAGLKMSGTYCVYDDNQSSLINCLLHATAWDSLGNGYCTNVVGSPTIDQLKDSYIKKNPFYTYDGGPLLTTTCEDKNSRKDLYVPHASEVSNCYGYWLASKNDSITVGKMDCDGYMGYDIYNNDIYCIRPVVTIPLNRKCTKGTSGGDVVWTLQYIYN